MASLPEGLAPSRWRWRSDDPRTAWGWTFRHNARIELVRERFHGRRGIAFGALLIGVPTALLAAHKPTLIASFFGPMVGNVFLRRRRHAEAHGALPTIVESSEATDALPVTMTVFSDRRKTAREVGWLSLAGGWLVFEGLRTTVSLKPDSAERVVENHGSVRFWIADGRDVGFALLTEAAETTLPALGSQRQEVAEMVQSWQRGSRPEGESVFPPTAIHPEIVGDSVGRAFLWSAAFAPLALLVGIWGDPWWGLGFGVVATTALAIFLARILAFRRDLPTLIEEPFARQALPLQ